jgi:FkbM family methyltransferase
LRKGLAEALGSIVYVSYKCRSKRCLFSYKSDMGKVWFQIGTNDGNDLFRNHTMIDKPDTIVLVEPNLSLLNSIEKSYELIRKFANVYIYMNAIYYENNKEVELVIPSKNGEYGKRAENGITYGDKHFSLLAMNDWGNREDMVKIKATTITFDQICANHNITHINYLQIDTEGFDTEIIKMIDLKKYTIDSIRFEKWSFEPEKYERYHSNQQNDLGASGLAQTIEKLTAHNYTLHDINDADGNDIIAIRNLS